MPSKETRRKAQAIVEAIITDFSNRSGFNGIWSGVDNFGKKIIKRTWVELVVDVLEPPTSEPNELPYELE